MYSSPHKDRESFRNQGDDLPALKTLNSRRLLLMIVYLLVYLFVLISHIYMSRLSDNHSNRSFLDNEGQKSTYIGLNFAVSLLSLIGWCTYMDSNPTCFSETVDFLAEDIVTNVNKN